jgi:hypothetical protein
MFERILLLTRSFGLAKPLGLALARWGVDSLVYISDPALFEPSILETEDFTTIIVGKSFQGDCEDTAKWVRHIRSQYGNPIIGVNDVLSVFGDMRLLRVAGCNYLSQTADPNMQLREVLDFVWEIESNLPLLR